MRALNLYNKQDIRYEETVKPILEEVDDVIIQVKAAGICGSDLSRYKKLGPYVEGMTFGHEFSGVVVETGASVTNVSVGDKVAACPTFNCGTCHSCMKGELSRCENLTLIGAKLPGAFAEYVKLPVAHVLKVPNNVDYDSASMVEPSAVVAHGFYRSSLKPGGSVAIMGCGNIGLLAIQWAKIFGAETVYAIDIDDAKLETAKSLGADVCINSLNQPAHEQIAEHTNGLGVDLAMEAAGSPITSQQVLALSKKGGEVVYLGIPYADVPMERFYFEKIVRNELSVLGSWNAISSPFPGKEWTASLHFMSTGQINISSIISHRLPLSEGPEIFERMTTTREPFGKVLFYPENE